MSLPAIEIVPYPISANNRAAWWTPIDVWNGYEFYAYTADCGTAGYHQVEVARRDPSGGWTRGICRNADGSIPIFVNDSGHAQASCKVAGDGTVFVFSSMHTDPWRVFASRVPGDVSSLYDYADQMPDQAPDRPDPVNPTMGFTYPVLDRDGQGNVYVWARRRNPSPWDTDLPGRVYKYDLTTKRFSLWFTVVSVVNSSTYTDEMIIDKLGRAHFVWENGPPNAGEYRHEPSYVYYDPATLLTKAIDGQTVVAPVRKTEPTSVPIIFEPMITGEAYYGNSSPSADTTPAVQICKGCLAADKTSFGMAVYRRRITTVTNAWDIKAAEWVAGAWVQQVVAQAAGGFDANAALSVTNINGEYRLYFSVANAGKSVLVMARRAASEAAGSTVWTYYIIGQRWTGDLRMRAIESDGKGLVFVALPDVGQLMRYAIPADLSGTTVYTDYASVRTAIGAMP